MTDTLIALFFAHILADFVLQTNWISENKRQPRVLLLHAAIVLLVTQAALGVVNAPVLLALALAHLVIDAVKAHWMPKTLWSFLTDQAAHLLTLLAIAAYVPDLWSTGLWAGCPAILWGMVVLAGLITATRAGGFAVGLLMQAHKTETDLPPGLENGGKTIGYLERGLIFALVLVGQPAGIGFLIAAKSILRFGTVSEDRAASEYVIIGTLASFGWALIVAYATFTAINLLPPLAPLP